MADYFAILGIKRHPDVEDHVTIYPNAVILGCEGLYSPPVRRVS